MPPRQSTAPLMTASPPVNVPATRLKLTEAMAPLKLALLLTRLTPPPLNCVSALKVALPLAKLMVPDAALMMPALLVKLMPLPMVVEALPPLF